MPNTAKGFESVTPVRVASPTFRREPGVSLALPQLPPPLVIVETNALPTPKLTTAQEELPLMATMRAMANWLLLLLLLVLAARGIYEYRKWYQKRLAARAGVESTARRGGLKREHRTFFSISLRFSAWPYTGI
jgi:hypothetical protein